MITGEQCFNCLYWKGDKRPITNGGQCRRFPPPQSSEATPNRWPVTLYRDWCGEYRPYGDIQETARGVPPWRAATPPTEPGA